MKPCPHCFLKYGDLLSNARESGRRMLHQEQALNPLSRRTNEYICQDCGKAEGMADMCMPNAKGDADEMFRLVTYQDRMEGRRLPPGIPWGPSMTPTTGSVVGFDDPQDDKCPKCGSFFVYGYSCTECHTVRPALKQLKGHPLQIALEVEYEKEKAAAEQRAEQEKVRRHEADMKWKADRYIGQTRSKLCVNCNETELQSTSDYICVRCRASEELVDNPLLQYVLAKLEERKGV